MPRGPLPPIANQVAQQAMKGAVGGKVQQLIDAQVARVTGPLLARIEELERRIAALERRRGDTGAAVRSDEI